jgi:PilZ domain
MNTGRNNPCFNVQWPILYRGQDFVGEGTMVDLSLEGGRFAGTMPVAVGMQLGLFIDSPLKSEDLIIEEAVVIWVREQEFGARFARIKTDDHQWLRRYIDDLAEQQNRVSDVSDRSTHACEVPPAGPSNTDPRRIRECDGRFPILSPAV